MGWCEQCGGPVDDAETSTTPIGDYVLEMSPFGQGLRLGADVLPLTKQEALILGLLAKRRQASFGVLAHYVTAKADWGIGAQLCRLRKKLRAFAGDDIVLETVGVGKCTETTLRLVLDPPAQQVEPGSLS